MQQVFRIESAGESAVQFGSLLDATREPPMSGEATVATSLEGVVLAEVSAYVERGEVRYGWAFTVAGRDVLRGQVVGMAVAS